MNKDDIIKKAHAIGDVHPKDSSLVWTLLTSGKEDWRKQGGRGSVTSSSTAKPMSNDTLKEWASKTDDSKLITFAGAKNAKAEQRIIAREELEKRGVDISGISTTGTLDDHMAKQAKINKMVGNGAKPAAASTDDIADGAEVDLDGQEAIREEWYLNKNDPRVQKTFNKLIGKADRIRYDKFVYKQKIKDPNYIQPDEVIFDLNAKYLEFLENDGQRFMISAGGAGIGKTYGFNGLAKELNMRPFQEGDTPGDGDYDIFEATDVASGKQLLTILKAHNGKIILFDDTDKVITRADCASVMKKATSATGKRIIGDPDDVKSNFEFTGRIMVMTNKDVNTLSENEDTKAILSRGVVSEIYLTIHETIETMKSRFQDYEFDSAPRLDDAAEDDKERQELLDLIIRHENNIDPAQFTTRTFSKILNERRTATRANLRKQSANFQKYLGTKDKDWETQALQVLTKADDNEFVSSVETFEKAETFQEVVIVPEVIEKSFEDQINEMSIEKAESLLFEETEG